MNVPLQNLAIITECPVTFFVHFVTTIYYIIATNLGTIMQCRLQVKSPLK